MIKNYLFLFIAILLTKWAIGQENENGYILEIPSVDKEAVFEKTLKLLMTSNYFIVSTDEESGFIQCKTVTEDKRLISRKKGEVIHYNFLIQSTDNENTDIYIQANVTVKSFTGSVGNSGYHNDDSGVTHSPQYLDPIIEYLKLHLVSNK